MPVVPAVQIFFNFYFKAPTHTNVIVLFSLIAGIYLSQMLRNSGLLGLPEDK